ncbi:hypothetical protein [Actinoplanes rectilineatus]|uniref:hypothetical protein n=1 Tax=Actinoplanes rectilineatus TaxID=113571 RepID=UPI0012FCCEFF|nr:hypothetical protein [Actinoplanes rectilineatus]
MRRSAAGVVLVTIRIDDNGELADPDALLLAMTNAAGVDNWFCGQDQNMAAAGAYLRNREPSSVTATG